MKENPEPRASRMSHRVVYANIRSLRKILSETSLIAIDEDVYFFCSEILFSFRRHFSELMVPSFGKPMQLLNGEIDWFRGLAVYMRDGFSAYRLRNYECGYCEFIVVRICSNSHNLMCLACTRIQIYRIKFLTIYRRLWLMCNP